MTAVIKGAGSGPPSPKPRTRRVPPTPHIFWVPDLVEQSVRAQPGFAAADKAEQYRMFWIAVVNQRDGFDDTFNRSEYLKYGLILDEITAKRWHPNAADLARGQHNVITRVIVSLGSRMCIAYGCESCVCNADAETKRDVQIVRAILKNVETRLQAARTKKSARERAAYVKKYRRSHWGRDPRPDTYVD